MSPERLSLLHSPGFESALAGVETGDPVLVCRTLFGPNHPEAVVRVRGQEAWRAKRFPKALKVADYLAPMLVGAVAYDGRPARSRFDRTSGWWQRTADGWQPLEVVDLIRAVSEAADALLEAALSRAAAARDARSAEYPSARAWSAAVMAGTHDSALYETVDGAARLAAALDSLAARVAGGASTFGEVLANLRQYPALRLGDAEIADLLSAWLSSAADVRRWRPGTRVDAARIWQAYEDDGSPGAFLKSHLYRHLDRLLGERVDDTYRLPLRAEGLEAA